MQPILANYTASITELKKSPTQLLKDAGDEAVAILNHNVASAYLVPSGLYEKMMDIIDDYNLRKIVDERLNDGEKAISNKNQKTSCEMWQKHLGDRLPCNIAKDELESANNYSKPAVIKSSAKSA